MFSHGQFDLTTILVGTEKARFISNTQHSPRGPTQSSDYKGKTERVKFHHGKKSNMVTQT